LGSDPQTSKELCSIINFALRQDGPEELIKATAKMTRGINLRLCNGNRNVGILNPAADVDAAANLRDSIYHTPATGGHRVCYRGGGFDSAHRDFFTRGRQFRQPSFLPTSFKLEVAQQFLRERGGADCVLWRIYIHPRQLCHHVNLIKKTSPGLPDEQEYLFVPYSGFWVQRAEWKSGTSDDPHEIDLLAATDNKDADWPETLMLAPWS
jgi:hypothetical protein